jgi:hypothetical protein
VLSCERDGMCLPTPSPLELPAPVQSFELERRNALRGERFHQKPQRPRSRKPRPRFPQGNSGIGASEKARKHCLFRPSAGAQYFQLFGERRRVFGRLTRERAGSMIVVGCDGGPAVD